MNKNKIFAIILAVIAVLITVFIFGNSLKVAEESKQQSAGIVEAVVEAANEIGVKLDAESVSFFIRKSAHFCEYFILSAIIAAALALAFTNRKLIFISPLYCLLVALCDEFVFQNAAEGRSPEVRDCVIDLCGALLAVTAVYFVLFIIKKENSRVNVMVNYDIHVHTHLSSCADRKAFMVDYIKAASEIGLKTIGFADHAWDKSVEGASPWYAPQDYKRLFARYDELKELDTNGVKVLLGAEGEFAQLVLALGDEGRKYVDYVIVPHSHTHMRGVVLPSDCVGIPEKHAEYLVKSFLSLCKHEKRNLFFGIAHPMYPIGDTPEYTQQIYSFITDEMLDECALAAKEANVAIEANLSVLKNIPPESGDNFCYRRFFDACKRAGCEFFMGSDAHCVDVMKNNHAMQANLIALVGLEEADFKSAQHHIQNA